jgi:hypothetical protein
LADISGCLKLKIIQKIIYFGENHEQKEIIQLQVAVLEVSLGVSMRTPLIQKSLKEGGGRGGGH